MGCRCATRQDPAPNAQLPARTRRSASIHLIASAVVVALARASVHPHEEGNKGRNDPQRKKTCSKHELHQNRHVFPQLLLPDLCSRSFTCLLRPVHLGSGLEPEENHHEPLCGDPSTGPRQEFREGHSLYGLSPGEQHHESDEQKRLVGHHHHPTGQKPPPPPTTEEARRIRDTGATRGQSVRTNTQSPKNTTPIPADSATRLGLDGISGTLRALSHVEKETKKEIAEIARSPTEIKKYQTFTFPPLVKINQSNNTGATDPGQGRVRLVADSDPIRFGGIGHTSGMLNHGEEVNAWDSTPRMRCTTD